MDKAWDAKGLVANLKGRGLDIAEDAAKILVEEVLNWTEESVKLSENKFDDAALLLLPTLKKAALEAVDKIDGKVG